jgi:hypothetical protein
VDAGVEPAPAPEGVAAPQEPDVHASHNRPFYSGLHCCLPASPSLHTFYREDLLRERKYAHNVAVQPYCKPL